MFDNKLLQKLNLERVWTTPNLNNGRSFGIEMKSEYVSYSEKTHQPWNRQLTETISFRPLS